jgi:hypothetical protein
MIFERLTSTLSTYILKLDVKLELGRFWITELQGLAV